jgi:hypothetical protein
MIARAGHALERWPALWPIGAALLAFAAGCALLVPPLGPIYSVFAGPVNLDFTIAIWHLSWLENGLVKRGLPGTLTDLLGLTADPTLLFVAHFVALAAAAIVIGVIAAHATLRLAPTERLVVLALLVSSPALFIHAGRDVGRLTPVLLLALFGGARLLASGYILLAALLLFAAGLVHEVVVLVGGALFGVIALDQLTHGRHFTTIEWVKNALAAGVLLGLLVATSTFKPTGLAQAYLSAAPYVQNRNELSNALSWFNADITMNIGENLCYFRNYPLRWAYLAITAAFIAVHVPALFAPFGRSRVVLAGLMAATFAPLAFLAIDIGRWAALVVAGLWAYYLVVLASQEQPMLKPGRPSVIVLAALYLLGPFTVSETLAVPQPLLRRLVGVPSQSVTAAVCAPRFPNILLSP